MFHIWQFDEPYYYKELENGSLLYGIDEFASIYKAHGLTNELKHDIIKTCFDDIDREVLGYMCNPGFDYNLTSFLKKIRIVLLQKIIIKEEMKDILALTQKKNQ